MRHQDCLWSMYCLSTWPERCRTASRLPPCTSLSDAWDHPKPSGCLQAGFTICSLSSSGPGWAFVGFEGATLICRVWDQAPECIGCFPPKRRSSSARGGVSPNLPRCREQLTRCEPTSFLSMFHISSTYYSGFEAI